MSQCCTHTGHSASCLQKSHKAQTFCVLSDYTNMKLWLTTHAMEPRHVDLRACTRLLPVVYLHVLRTCVLLAHWTCPAHTSCTVHAYCAWPRCVIKGAPKVGFWARDRTPLTRWSVTKSVFEFGDNKRYTLLGYLNTVAGSKTFFLFFKFFIPTFCCSNIIIRGNDQKSKTKLNFIRYITE